VLCQAFDDDLSLERIVFDEYDLRITSQAWIFFPLPWPCEFKSGTVYTYGGNLGYVLLLLPMGRIADRVPANLGVKAPHSDATSSKAKRASLLPLRLGAGHASLHGIGEEADKLALSARLHCQQICSLPSHPRFCWPIGGGSLPRTCIYPPRSSCQYHRHTRLARY
jgi:hypothetical protein